MEFYFADPRFNKSELDSQYFKDQVTISFRYADKHKPPSTDVFKVFQLASDDTPLKNVTVAVLNVSVTPVGNFNEPFGKTRNISYTEFDVNITIAPKEIGKYQLFYEIQEHDRRFNKKGPTFRILENCE